MGSESKAMHEEHLRDHADHSQCLEEEGTCRVEHRRALAVLALAQAAILQHEAHIDEHIEEIRTHEETIERHERELRNQADAGEPEDLELASEHEAFEDRHMALAEEHEHFRDRHFAIMREIARLDAVLKQFS